MTTAEALRWLTNESNPRMEDYEQAAIREVITQRDRRAFIPGRTLSFRINAVLLGLASAARLWARARSRRIEQERIPAYNIFRGWRQVFRYLVCPKWFSWGDRIREAGMVHVWQMK